MDRYTRFVLTVIAAALVWIGVRVGAPIADSHAGYQDTKVEIADISVSRHRPLPVEVSGELVCIK